MYRITVEAFDLTDDFIDLINNEHDVKIIDDSKGPWDVVFQGEKSDLRKMLSLYWAMEEDAIDDVIFTPL